MADSILSNPDILMGKGIIGGGKRKAKSNNSKSIKPKSMKPKSNKVLYRGGFFFNSSPQISSPGEEYKCYSCVKVAPPENPVVVNSAQSVSDVNVKVPEPPKPPVSQSGGAMGVKALYKQKLNALDVEKLRKMAINRGINIRKKKNGKTVYVKKATIVQKLCDFKHGK